MLNLVDQAAHDIVKKRQLLDVKVFRSGDKQVGYLPQDLCAGPDVFLRNRCFKFVYQRRVAHGGFLLATPFSPVVPDA
jgi:hypothetical protein